jgi:alkylresorcinol/alkylpyrone synthase
MATTYAGNPATLTNMAAVPAHLVRIATAVPPIVVTADEIWTALGRVRGRAMPRASGMEGARTRHLAQPLPSLMRLRTQNQQTDAYLEHARVLARAVCCDVLAETDRRDDVGLVIGVSCTGVVLPSLDAELIPVLQLPPTVGRLPITELGCGGGVAGLARAVDYLRAYPGRSVLLFAVELPSLTFQPDDRSLDNLVAAMVFGDGAGAALLRGGDSPHGVVVEHCGTALIPDGASSLGFELRDGGLRVVLSRELPQVVEAHLRDAVETFLTEAGLTLADIDVVAAHPGGPRIFEAIERSLDLPPDALTVSRRVFADYANASSAGIFFVLDALVKCRASGRALAIAFGPGLSIELALLRLGT